MGGERTRVAQRLTAWAVSAVLLAHLTFAAAPAWYEDDCAGGCSTANDLLLVAAIAAPVVAGAGLLAAFAAWLRAWLGHR